METLVQDLRHTLRLFRRSPGFTSAAVLTLAVGIGVNTTMFGVVNGVLLEPLPYPEPDRIVRVAERVMKMPGRSVPIITSDTFHAWRDEGETLEQLAAYTPRSFTMTGRGEARRVRGTAISAAMLPLLRVHPRLGRGFTDTNEQPEAGVKALLSHRFWRDELGADPDVVGSFLKLDAEAAEIVGVMDESFAFPGSRDRDLGSLRGGTAGPDSRPAQRHRPACTGTPSSGSDSRNGISRGNPDLGAGGLIGPARDDAGRGCRRAATDSAPG